MASSVAADDDIGLRLKYEERLSKVEKGQDDMKEDIRDIKRLIWATIGLIILSSIASHIHLGGLSTTGLHLTSMLSLGW